EESLNHYGLEPKLTANWLLNDLLGQLSEAGKDIESSPVSPANLAELVKFIKDGVLSSKLAKEVLKEMVATGKSPAVVVEEKGLKQVSDEETIKAMLEEVLRENASEVQRYKTGEEKLFGFLVGQVMKKTKGKANPQVVNKLLKEALKG
ncbi:MAG: Asp-tRNA(Asn)/Glu-tRNA(Gln) amidotransferase GatCAB subunit B, partial [Aquificaceae bacterium]|nr:Asp-tRNA(Asn)/Glu-tRNA(Gln) amidotransferase GatCAB subunit B [Aquificaceae bacterium]